jgi:uncharacterized protein (DUF433 family)
MVKGADVCGGRPTFKYTWIEVAGSLDRINGGEEFQEVVNGYRGKYRLRRFLKQCR